MLVNGYAPYLGLVILFFFSGLVAYGYFKSRGQLRVGIFCIGVGLSLIGVISIPKLEITLFWFAIAVFFITTAIFLPKSARYFFGLEPKPVKDL